MHSHVLTQYTIVSSESVHVLRHHQPLSNTHTYTHIEYICENVMTHLFYHLQPSLSPSDTLTRSHISTTTSHTRQPAVKTCGSRVLIITVSLTVIFVVFHRLSCNHSHTNQISLLQTISATVEFSSSMTQNKNIRHFPMETTEQ